jgi:K+-sensing histidine kinase KdpD
MRFFTIIFVLLFLYTLSAILFWEFSLQKQSQRIFELQVVHLRSQVDSMENPVAFNSQLKALEDTRIVRRKQYMGEGSTFLLVILIGAAVVFASFVRSVRLSRQQNNFMLSVTHELKSPIAAMKLNLQTLEKYQLDENTRMGLLDKCIKEANRLNDLCNNILLASQMEGGQYKTSKEKMDIADLVDVVLSDYEQRYPNRFIRDISSDQFMINGDRLMLQLAIHNLIENALKYSAADKNVKVALNEKSKQVCLQVIDEGIGISDSEKLKIFKKFYRTGNENTRKTKGTGLGLYLTQRIARQHGGRISVKDNQPAGSIFELTIPLA